MRSIAILLMLCFLYSYKDYKDSKPDMLIDSRDGNEYRVITIGGKSWMLDNFQLPIEGSSCYEDNNAYCKEHGRLYSHEAAMKAAPKGWHLPSRDEWEKLIKDLQQESSGLYKAALETMQIQLSGYIDDYGDPVKKDYQTRFWSNTEWGNDNSYAWYCGISRSREMMEMDVFDKKCRYSVRYVKN